jgi:hypothetical protein
MGATTWDYFTDYEDDAGAALQKLREKVFREGKYERFTFSSKKPQTIDDLLEGQGESGTHSILDIQGVSPEPEFGAVCPMPVERLQELFGTDKPTRKMVEEKLGDEELIEDPLVSERWQGVYFTVYRDGRPNELYFIGTSGD